MNGGFALELKLKYLHVLETNMSAKHGHQLKLIFNELSSESQAAITEKLKAIVKKSSLHQKISKHFRKHVGIPFRWDASELLHKASRAFERSRYPYEEETDLTWFAGYSEIMEAIDFRILSVTSKETSS
jgi:hypothetical protein